MTYREWFLSDAPMIVIGAQVALVLRALPTPWDVRATMAFAGFISFAWMGMRLWDKWEATR